jgi:hypothetical protein
MTEGGEAIFPLHARPMKEEFRFSSDDTPPSGRPDKNPDVPTQPNRHKPLHHLPRGKAWNPPILKKWWFWPASIAALVALNMAVSLWDAVFRQ